MHKSQGLFMGELIACLRYLVADLVLQRPLPNRFPKRSVNSVVTQISHSLVQQAPLRLNCRLVRFRDLGTSTALVKPFICHAPAGLWPMLPGMPRASRKHAL